MAGPSRPEDALPAEVPADAGHRELQAGTSEPQAGTSEPQAGTGEPQGRTGEPPPPLEANDRLVAAVITAGWVVALIVLLAVRPELPPRERWWIWTAAAGVGLGLFGLGYLPYFKRARARAARRRAKDPP